MRSRKGFPALRKRPRVRRHRPLAAGRVRASARRLALACLACWLAALPSLGFASSSAKPFVVVIDPGHGGADLGAVFSNGKIRVAEKDVTLAIASEAARQIRARGIRAVLTRANDKELALAHRTQVANKLKADLFVSIHLNSMHSPQLAEADGVETYILNNTTDASSKRLAHLENQVLTDTHGPLDVELILKDLRLDANLSESKRLACIVQGKLTRGLVGHRNRGVRQALFHVLLGADMPSILLEAGFLTSPKDRAMVLSTAGRRSMALAIAQAVDQFRRSRNTPKALTELANCKVH